MPQVPEVVKSVKEKLPSNAFWLRVGAVALTVAGLALAAPIIWNAAEDAGAGLFVLLILGALGVGLFQALPFIGQTAELTGSTEEGGAGESDRTVAELLPGQESAGSVLQDCGRSDRSPDRKVSTT